MAKIVWLFAIAIVAGGNVGPANAQLTRTFISASGSDANSP